MELDYTAAVEVVAEATADELQDATNAQPASDAEPAAQHWEKIETLWSERQQVAATLSATREREKQNRIEFGRELRGLQEVHAKPGHGDFIEVVSAELQKRRINITVKTVYAWIKLSREADGLDVKSKPEPEPKPLPESGAGSGSSFTPVKDEAPQPIPSPVTVERFDFGDDTEAPSSDATQESTSDTSAELKPEPDSEAESHPAAEEEELAERFRLLLVAPLPNTLEFYSVIYAAAKLLGVPHEVLPGIGITVYRKVAAANYDAYADESADVA